jgi:hypothetical protein
MAKPKKYCVLMLITFLGILAMPLLSAPAEPLTGKGRANMLCFEAAVEHSSQWLIRSVVEGEEFSSGHVPFKQLVLFDGGANLHSIVQKVRFFHVLERNHFRLPKERLHLLHSVLTI